MRPSPPAVTAAAPVDTEKPALAQCEACSRIERYRRFSCCTGFGRADRSPPMGSPLSRRPEVFPSECQGSILDMDSGVPLVFAFFGHCGTGTGSGVRVEFVHLCSLAMKKRFLMAHLQNFVNHQFRTYKSRTNGKYFAWMWYDAAINLPEFPPPTPPRDQLQTPAKCHWGESYDAAIFPQEIKQEDGMLESILGLPQNPGTPEQEANSDTGWTKNKPPTGDRGPKHGGPYGKRKGAKREKGMVQIRHSIRQPVTLLWQTKVERPQTAPTISQPFRANDSDHTAAGEASQHGVHSKIGAAREDGARAGVDVEMSQRTGDGGDGVAVGEGGNRNDGRERALREGETATSIAPFCGTGAGQRGSGEGKTPMPLRSSHRVGPIGVLGTRRAVRNIVYHSGLAALAASNRGVVSPKPCQMYCVGSEKQHALQTWRRLPKLCSYHILTHT